jgi:hypothetical protein
LQINKQTLRQKLQHGQTAGFSIFESGNPGISIINSMLKTYQSGRLVDGTSMEAGCFDLA